MPYVPRDQRERLDPHIDQLVAEISALAGLEPSYPAFAGLLNYACTRLAARVLPERRYWAIATVTGVLENVADEFYRRVVVPYEEQRKAEHGDVYDT
jgi:hypothetical protein